MCIRQRGFLVLLLLVMACAPILPVSADVPGRVNLQGLLTDDTGTPVADGSYAMRFHLYDAEIGGAQLWNAPNGEQQSVTLANGVYNVQLGSVEPLNSVMFDGGAVWLEVAIYNSSTAIWETMSPRQRVTAVAYALKAADADSVEGYVSSDFALQTHTHDARYVNEGQANSISSSMIVDGSIVSVDLDANSVTASKIAPSSVRSSEVVNNSLTALDLATDSVTADELAKNAVTSAHIADGSVASGDLADGAALAEILDDDGPGSGLNADYLDNLHASAFSTTTHDHDSLYLNESGDSMSVSTSGTALSVTNTGSGYGLTGRAKGNAGRGVYAHADATGSVSNYGLYGIAAGDTGRAVYGWATASGDVQNYGVSGIASGDDGRGVYGSASGAHGRGVKGDASGTSGIGVYGYASNSGNVTNYGGYFQARGEDGRAVYGYASSSGSTAYNYGGYFRAEGNYGRGVYGLTYGDNGYGVYGSSNGANGIGGFFYGSDTGLVARGDQWAAEFRGNVRIRNRNTLATVLELGEGLDYAEGFDVSDAAKPEAGSVLVIDPDNPGKLTISTKAYDTKVAGIVAGANGLGSGVRLGSSDFDNDVALAGRVYCKVEASEEAVVAGDLLTTSDLPGYARKVSDYGRAQGAILGKAMQGMEQGETGKILVLVTLQ